MAGIQDVTLSRIPEQWNAAWFTKFCREVLSLADARNALGEGGITITGTPGAPATIDVSGAISPLLNIPFVTLSTSTTLTAERVLSAGSGIALTDNGAGSTITVSVSGINPSDIGPINGLSVLGRSASTSGYVAPITATQEGDVLTVQDFSGSNFAVWTNTPIWTGQHTFEAFTLFQNTVDIDVGQAGVTPNDINAFRIRNLASNDGGFRFRTFDALGPAFNDCGNELGIWEEDGTNGLSATTIGFRWLHAGDIDGSGDLIFYSHYLSAAGQEIYRHQRDLAQMLFVGGTAAAPTVCVTDYQTGMYSGTAGTLRFAAGGVQVLGVTATSFNPLPAIRAADGSVSFPVYSFVNDTNSGIYRIGADNVGLSTNGVLRFDVSTTRNTWTLPHGAAAGSAGTPSWSFSGDTNTGMYNIGADNLGFSTNGTLRVDLDTSRLLVNLPIRATNATTGIEIESVTPRLLFDETDAAANERLWDIVTSGGDFFIRTRTDADGAGLNFLRVTRTGSSLIDSATFRSGATVFETSAGTLVTSFDTAGFNIWNGSVFSLYNSGDVDVGQWFWTGNDMDQYWPNELSIHAAYGAFRMYLNADGDLALPADNQEFRTGANNDLILFHDGTNSVIENQTGNLILRVGGELALDEVTTTAVAPAAGGAGALPATPTGYMTVNINGTNRQMAYY